MTLTAVDPSAAGAGLPAAQCTPAGTEPHAPLSFILELEGGGPAVSVKAEVLLRPYPGTEIAVVVPCIDAPMPVPVVVLPVDSKRRVASRWRGGCSRPVVGLHDVGGRDTAGDEQEGGELGELHLASCVVAKKCK